MAAGTHRHAPTPAHAELHAALACLVIVVAVLAAYVNSFPGTFFFDDADAILLNESIRDLGAWKKVLWPPVQAGIGGRPFANITFALNYAIGGDRPGVYHATNVVIHALGALLLFGLTRRTLLSPALRARYASAATPIACIVALLWALNPLQTNVVDYASQRTEGLMAALYFLTLYAFVRYVEGGSRGWSAFAVIACLLGMATKEGMVTAPVMALLYDRTFFSGSFVAAFRRHAGTYAGFGATWVVLAGLMLTSKLGDRGVGFGLGHTALDYALTEVRAIVRYAQLSWWPYPLIFDYGPLYARGLGEVWASALIIVVALAATILAIWRAPAAGFAAAWFFIALAPSSSVIPVAQQPCAENRVYLPLAGIAALTAAGAYRWAGRRGLAALAVGAVALGTATLARNPVFQSELTLWHDTVAKRPENHRAENNLGYAYLKRNLDDEALKHFEAAIRLSPNYADAHNNRGVVLLRKRRPVDALVEFDTATKHKAGYADAQYNKGEAFLQLRMNAEAIEALRLALRMNPRNAKAYNNLGIALLDSGKVQESIDAERRAIGLNPNLPEAHYNLANSLGRAGRKTEALAEYDETLRIDPRFAKAHNNAGVLLMELGRYREAATRFEAALRIDPAYGDAFKNLQLVRSRPS
jgi:tetratricopeptide (TPR) repeat protein